MQRSQTASRRRLTGPWIVTAVAVLVCLITLYFLITNPDSASIVAFVAAFGSAVAAINDLVQQRRQQENPGRAISADKQAASRAAMLRKVEYLWIDNVLQKSVLNAGLIDLDLKLDADAVRDPYNMILSRQGYEDEQLPRGVSIVSVFERVGGALLILGEPGAGKTTTLLQLTQALLLRARDDGKTPIPVVFNLSSWSPRFRSLTDWLVNELVVRYQAPTDVADFWVNEAQLTPLLDGLDEVSKERRNECIAALNAYRQRFGLGELVVASRSAEYLELGGRLELPAAVIIQPLSLSQVDAYLVAGREHLEGARHALKRDADLQNMIRTPLALTIFIFAYRGLKVDEILTSGTEEQLRRRLYNAYIGRVLHWRSKHNPAEKRTLLVVLRWLACVMQRLSQTVFLLEGLQPQWLVRERTIDGSQGDRHTPRWLLPSYLLVSRSLVGLAVGTVIFIALRAGSYVTVMVSGSTQYGYLGLEVGLAVAAGTALGTLGADALRLHLERKRGQSPLGWRYTALVIFGIGVATAAVTYPFAGLTDALIMGLSNALLSGLLIGLRDGSRPLLQEIQVVEKLGFSWRKALTSLLPVFLIGLAVGYSIGQIDMSVATRISGPYLLPITRFFRALLSGILLHTPNTAVALAAIVSVMGATTFGLLGGLVGGTLDERIQPNQGVRLSMRNALFVGALIGVVQSVLWGGIVQLSSWYIPALIAAVLFGLLPGCLAALWHGGIDVIRHYTLRLHLAVAGLLPLRTIYYLNMAADSQLLIKTGGAYVFVHKTLLDHFAGLTDAEIKALTPKDGAFRTPINYFVQESGPITGVDGRRLAEAAEETQTVSAIEPRAGEPAGAEIVLSGSQLGRLCDALESAFTEGELQRLMRVHFDENLDSIAGGDNYREKVFHLVEWAQRTHQIEKLLDATLHENPTNGALADLVKSLRL